MRGGALNANGVEDDVAAYPSFLDYKKSFANFFTKLIVFFINLETAKVEYLLIYITFTNLHWQLCTVQIQF